MKPGDKVAKPNNWIGSRGTEAERFWRKVKSDSAQGCWSWTGAKSKKGYGSFKLAGALKTIPSHIWSYLNVIGEIPKGILVHHKCENPNCVNWLHLELVSRSDHFKRHEHLWHRRKVK